MENSINGASKRRKRGGGAATRREARLNAPVVFPKATKRNIPTYDVLASEGWRQLMIMPWVFWKLLALNFAMMRRLNCPDL